MRVTGIQNRGREEADLDITPFMNLMIVLVPVLLLSMVFTRITVVDLQLPEAAGSTAADLGASQVEVVVRDASIDVNFPEGILLRKIDNHASGQPDFKQLTVLLQELKRRLQEKQADRKNINILIEPATPYQKIVATIDAVRSYSAVVAADQVDAELFPDISFGDAPVASIAGITGVN